MNARPITWPTVPKGRDRVRVCLHAGNTKEDVERLVEGVVGWAKGALEVRQRGVDGKRKERARMVGGGSGGGDVGSEMLASKL
jgi:8-amino-7-oxononanoate synthase